MEALKFDGQCNWGTPSGLLASLNPSSVKPLPCFSIFWKNKQREMFPQSGHSLKRIK